jgi:elongation factor G
VRCGELRERLVEAACEQDDTLMELYLSGRPLSAEALLAALRRGTISLSFVPVLCGASFRNKGVQPLLDAVVDFLPSPLDVPAIVGIVPDSGARAERRADAAEPFAALAFKIVTDPVVGQLTFSGSQGTLPRVARFNASRGRQNRVGRLLQMHADKRGRSRVSRPATSPPRSACATALPATPSVPSSSRSSWKPSIFPNR